MDLLEMNDLRRRIVAGEDVSDEELHEALTALRQNRRLAAETKTKKASTKSAPLNLDDLFVPKA